MFCLVAQQVMALLFHKPGQTGDLYVQIFKKCQYCFRYWVPDNMCQMTEQRPTKSVLLKGWATSQQMCARGSKILQTVVGLSVAEEVDVVMKRE